MSTNFEDSSLVRILKKQVNAQSVIFNSSFTPENSIAVALGEDKFFIESEKQINNADLKDDLIKDLEYQKGFLQSVEKKLSNKRFVQNAKPEIIALEQKKKADAEAKIKVLEESLANL